jgi:hypothetical protein
MLRILVLVFAALLPLTPARSRADVAPPAGLKYVEARHVVQGAASIPNTHKLALVTTRRSDPKYLQVRWSGFEGPVDVPKGYMLKTYFVALTDAQLAELAKRYAKALPAEDATRKALETAAPDAVAALMAKTEIAPGPDLEEVARFLSREDLAISPLLAFRTVVAESFEGSVVTESWRIEGLKEGRIAMSPVVTSDRSASGKGCMAGGETGVLAALAALVLVGRRMRRRAAAG